MDNIILALMVLYAPLLMFPELRAIAAKSVVHPSKLTT